MADAGAALAQAEQPEAASGFLNRKAPSSSGFMAVTANAYATDAAAEMLLLGGNATDAAIAAQWVLNLVEPQSSGMGGGGFLLHWDAKHSKVTAWDGRETAPRSASADFARRPDGSLNGFYEVVATGKSVGVPGLVAMFELVHRRHGKLRWERLTRPAIRLAMNGFVISPRLHRLLAKDKFLRRNAAAHALYYQADGEAKAVGEVLRNPEFATSLRKIAEEGAAAIHQGDLANRIVTEVGQRGGAMTTKDLFDYQPRQRQAVCGPYRQWRICGMPPPSSGGISVIQLLGLMEHSRLPSGDPATPASAHLFAEAGRLTYADRARYLADPDFVPVPQRELLDPRYLEQRARLINPERSMGVVQPGELPTRQALADDNAPELPSTTHMSIVDQEGNAVALTSSVESAFGSRIQVGGFLLNNQLTDFSFVAERDGRPVANRLQPGKRPLSSMSPTLVFDADGRLYAVLGSPGGSRIINYVARTLIALLDGNYDPARAVAQLHVGNRNGATEIERGVAADGLALELARRGHTIKRDDMTSGLHMIVRSDDKWLSAVDPRREGAARGE
ncbi:MAG: gamma-glutamyltransferase [Sulfuritalea sp.]|nr:gamma-glutamyltransferase [Sulfuritalea sp.]